MAKKILLLDTNVISNAMSKYGQEAYAAHFSTLLKEYKFGITLYTQYELLKSSDKAHQADILKYLSSDYFRVILTEEAMNFSARIYNLYKKHKDTKGFNITDGDIVNGAISIAKGCPIMTTDSNDYPRPFFSEISQHPLTYTSSTKRTVMDMVYILAPDVAYLKHCAKELEV